VPLSLIDPLYLRGRILAYFVMTSLLDLISLDARFRTQDDVNYLFMSFILKLTVFVGGAIVAVLHGLQDMPKVKREAKEEMYRPSAFSLTKVIIQVPCSFILGFAMVVPEFVILDYNFDIFNRLWLLYSATIFTLDSASEIFSLIPNAEAALFVFLQFALFLVYGSGVFTANEEIIEPLRSLYDIVPTHWAIVGLMNLIVLNSEDFSGAVPATDGSQQAHAARNAGLDYYCPDDGTGESVTCYGQTGEQALDSFQGRFSVIDRYISYGSCLGRVLAAALAFKIVSVVCYEASCAPAARRSAPPPEGTAESTALLATGPKKAYDSLPSNA